MSHLDAQRPKLGCNVTHMAHSTPKRQLVEDRLGQPLDQYLRTMREDDRSWRWIARKITEQTGVEVSHTLIRRALKDAA